MITTARAVMMVREELGRPPNNSPNNLTIMTKLNNNANTMLAELNITRDDESFKRLILTTQPALNEYTVAASDFGKPFLMETWDNGADPYYVPTEVTLTPIQNRGKYQDSSGFPNPANAANEVWSFFSEGSKHKAIVTPTPTETGYRRVYYEVDSYTLVFGGMAMPLRTAYMHLLVVRTAEDCLPDTEHPEPTYTRISNQLARKRGGPLVTGSLEAIWLMQRMAQAARSNERSYFGADRETYDGGGLF